MPRAVSLKSIEAQIKKLQDQKEKLQRNQKGPAIADILARMKKNGLTIEDLQNAKPPKGRKAPAKASAGRKPVAAKYRNPATGETWTGRGRAPVWMAREEAAGRKREEFLVTAAPAAN